MGTDTRVETDALDDGLRIETFYFGIGVKFVEIADAQGEVRVGEEFYGFRLFHTHEKAWDAFGRPTPPLPV